MLEITPHPRKNVRCDIAACRHPIKPLWINEKGSPMPLRFIICETHLKEIIEVGKAYLGIEDPKSSDDLIKEIADKDIIIEQLRKKIAEFEGEAEKIQEIKGEIDSMGRPDLIILAKSLNVKGKLVTMSDKDLIKKIKEAQAK